MYIPAAKTLITLIGIASSTARTNRITFLPPALGEEVSDEEDHGHEIPEATTSIRYLEPASAEADDLHLLLDRAYACESKYVDREDSGDQIEFEVEHTVDKGGHRHDKYKGKEEEQ
jgi:hypothetical protein